VNRSKEDIMKRSYQSLLIATIAVLATPAWGQAPGGSPLGKPAKPLQIAEWIKGDPVVLAQGKDKYIYVIEFWATTCPHSRGCIPYLTEMQKKYQDKDVVLVAISAERPEVVKEFVEQMGDQIGYLVGVDQQGRTTRTYLRYIDQIPYAFVVDKSGNVVWHGHPMSGLDKTVAAVIAGTHDLESAKQREQARSLVAFYMEMVKSPRKAEATTKDPDTGEARSPVSEVGERIVDFGREDFLLMNDFAWKIATEPGLIKRDLDLAMRAAQIAYDATEGKNVDILDTYARVLFERGQKKEAVECQREAVKLAATDEAREALAKTLAKYEKAAGED
jgi:thiol-disulfide isomerase/thioredoxin